MLRFSMQVHEDIFEMTDFGEPPQIAIWLENPRSGFMRTVWVANRAGRRLWKGKIECPTALPIWESRHKDEESEYRRRGLLKRVLDAVTGATPDGGHFQVACRVDEDETWVCFIEVNLSGDFNADFPYRDENGMPDPGVNGQPSLVYRADIKAVPGHEANFELVGRSDQWVAVDTINPDLYGMTSAKDAVTDIKVKCLQAGQSVDEDR